MTKVELNQENFEKQSILFQELLIGGVLVFQYAKKDGTLRNAVGTLKSDLIPVSKERYDTYESILKHLNETGKMDEHTKTEIESLFIPKESKGRNQSFDTQTYYDFEAKAFRSFSKSNLISFAY